MSLLRIFRNLAVLVILAVGGLSLSPRPRAAQNLCAAYACTPHNFDSCSLCVDLCAFHGPIIYNCYDVVKKRSCYYSIACVR